MSLVIKYFDIINSLIWGTETDHYSLAFFLKIAEPQSNHVMIADKPKLWDSLQNYWSIFSKVSRLGKTEKLLPTGQEIKEKYN